MEIEGKAIDRRGFIKGAVGMGALATAGIALAGRTYAEALEASELDWDYEADVVVVGYGGAGAAAAIAAHDNGAKVLILEKMAEPGGNTGISGGGYICPTDLDKTIAYMTEMYETANSDYDDAVMRSFVEESMKNNEWLLSLKEGTETSTIPGASFPEFAGADAIVGHEVLREEGEFASEALFNVLRYGVEEDRGIEVMLSTPGKELIKNSDDQVVGILATSSGKDILIKAKRGIVLTTGGFEFNATMQKNFLKGYPIQACGSPGNEGDGIHMAMMAGADLWHMNGSSCQIGIKVPGYEAGFIVPWPARNNSNFIWVDSDGRRFINELGVERHAGLLALDWFNPVLRKYPRIPFYYISDETQCAQLTFNNTTIGYNRRDYSWSKDNSAEIASGWIKKADTIADLALQIGLQPDVLESTVATYNEYAADGVDLDFARPEDTLHPLIDPPFYAIETYPMMLNSQGGPRRNAKGQIVNPKGEPIPRLYGAGELGSLWGVYYQGRGNIAECFAFGRISGANAAAETPWDA